MSKNLTTEEHLEALANAVKDYTQAEIGNIGGGSAFPVTNFTGASASSAGLSGLVPAPQAGDHDKFLCGNGTWAAVPGGSISYPIASASQAGLMSAEDKQHLDAVFLSSADLTDAVITVVGGDFLPSVDSLSDFQTYKDCNIQFFDNRLKKIINGDGSLGDIKPSTSDNSFLGGTEQVSIHADYSGTYTARSLTSNNHGTCSLPTDTNSVRSYLSSPFKLSETAGIFFQKNVQTANNWTDEYSGRIYALHFSLADNQNLSVATGTDNSICAAASSVTSANGSNDYNFAPSLLDPNHLIFFSNIHAENSSGYTEAYYYCSRAFKATNASITSTKAVTSIGTFYSYDVASKTVLTSAPTSFFFKPQISFAQSTVTVSQKAHTFQLPFLKYTLAVTNASKVVTSSTDYILIHHGAYGSAPSLLTWRTWTSGGGYTNVNSWLEDDDNLIAGIWRAKSSSSCLYAVTFKKGSYSLANWFDNSSSVWTFDFITPKVFKTTKKLSQIIDDLLL